MLRFSAERFGQLQEISRRVNMDEGAWAAELVERFVEQQLAPIPANWQDVLAQLMTFRTDVVTAGRLLNQLARIANQTGQTSLGMDRVLARVERLLALVDDLEADATERAGRAR